MKYFAMWVVIATAVLLAQIIGACIGTLVMSTKWYRKFITRLSIGMYKDMEGIDEETEEGKKILDYIKEDY